MIILDSSAILAFLWAEPGDTAVRDALAAEAVCTVVNWCEVATKVLAKAGDWSAAETSLTALGLRVIPIETVDAVAAGRLWLQYPALSLGDRLCLAAGARLGATILTTDRAWRPVSDSVRVIRAASEPRGSGDQGADLEGQLGLGGLDVEDAVGEDDDRDVLVPGDGLRHAGG